MCCPIELAGRGVGWHLVTEGWELPQIGLPAEECLERRALERGMVRRVILELRGGKPLAPLLRAIVHSAAHVHFEALVNALALSIGLRVVRRSVQELGVGGGEELAPHCTGEDLVSVGVGGAVQLNDGIPECSSNLSGVEDAATARNAQIWSGGRRQP